jgi:hypothetical protein
VSLQTKADTATEKKWRAIDAVAASDDGLYENFKDAEGRYEALKAASACSSSGPRLEWRY